MSGRKEEARVRHHHQIGDEVYATRVDIFTGNTSWMVGTIRAVSIDDATDSWLFDIEFMEDGEVQCGIAESSVQIKEDYEWLLNHGVDALKGVSACHGPSDHGYYETALTKKKYSSVTAAMRAYDAAFIKENKHLTKESYLNLPQEWYFTTKNGVPSRRSKSRRRSTDSRQSSSQRDSDTTVDEDGTIGDEDGKPVGQLFNGLEEQKKRDRASYVQEGDDDEERKMSTQIEASLEKRQKRPAVNILGGYYFSQSSDQEDDSNYESILQSRQKGYAHELQVFSWRSKERWDDLINRMRDEWKALILENSNDRDLDGFQTHQRERWSLFLSEEEALLKMNCDASDFISKMQSEHGENVTPEELRYQRRLLMYEERRLEYLEDLLRHLREDMDYFLMEPSNMQLERFEGFLEGQSERVRYYHCSQDAMLALHLQDCHSDLEDLVTAKSLSSQS